MQLVDTYASLREAIRHACQTTVGRHTEAFVTGPKDGPYEVLEENLEDRLVCFVASEDQSPQDLIAVCREGQIVERFA